VEGSKCKKEGSCVMTTDLVTMLARIDATLTCAVCQRSLSESVSVYYCSEDCQEDWYARRTKAIPEETTCASQGYYASIMCRTPGSLCPDWDAGETEYGRCRLSLLIHHCNDHCREQSRIAETYVPLTCGYTGYHPHHCTC
jgi:hypothetical protein